MGRQDAAISMLLWNRSILCWWNKYFLFFFRFWNFRSFSLIAIYIFLYFLLNDCLSLICRFACRFDYFLVGKSPILLLKLSKTCLSFACRLLVVFKGFHANEVEEGKKPAEGLVNQFTGQIRIKNQICLSDCPRSLRIVFSVWLALPYLAWIKNARMDQWGGKKP